MKLILPYFILILFLLQHNMKKNSKKEKINNETFWKRESEANSVRKKDISGLDYIRIPDERILKEWHTIEALKEKKILNLSGFTNTDLKLEYGVGNLTELTDYDNNYVTLSRSLARIAELLTEQGLKKEAAAFLEFGIATLTDIGKNYTLLAGYYMEYGKPDKIDFLIAQSEQISTLSKDAIIARLKDIQRGEASPA